MQMMQLFLLLSQTSSFGFAQSLRLFQSERHKIQCTDDESPFVLKLRFSLCILSSSSRYRFVLMCSTVLATLTAHPWVIKISLLYGIVIRGEAYLIPTWLMREHR